MYLTKATQIAQNPYTMTAATDVCIDAPNSGTSGIAGYILANTTQNVSGGKGSCSQGPNTMRQITG